MTFNDMTLGTMVEARTEFADGDYLRYVKVSKHRWLQLDGRVVAPSYYSDADMQDATTRGYTLVAAGTEGDLS